jgi:biotin synthase
MCLYAGANSIFYGDRLLTTQNPEPDGDAEMLRAGGLKPQSLTTETSGADQSEHEAWKIPQPAARAGGP